MYIVESKSGYIKEFTLIFDETSQWYKEAYKFKKKDLKKFFMLRDRKKYKVYQVNYEGDDIR